MMATAGNLGQVDLDGTIDLELIEQCAGRRGVGYPFLNSKSPNLVLTVSVPIHP